MSAAHILIQSELPISFYKKLLYRHSLAFEIGRVNQMGKTKFKAIIRGKHNLSLSNIGEKVVSNVLENPIGL